MAIVNNSGAPVTRCKHCKYKYINLSRYPPCGIEEFNVIHPDGGFINGRRGRNNIILSFAQFRPEKEHAMQVEIWKQVLEDPEIPSDAVLLMIGTCRNEADEQIVADIQKKAEDLGISHRIQIEKNKPRARIIELFSRAKVAIHTMRDEHFGIAVVELMASGIITIAHQSAGPKLDIIGVSPNPVGYLATDIKSYQLFIRKALKNFDDAYHTKMRVDAKEWVKKFGPEAFEQGFIKQL